MFLWPSILQEWWLFLFCCVPDHILLAHINQFLLLSWCAWLRGLVSYQDPKIDYQFMSHYNIRPFSCSNFMRVYCLIMLFRYIEDATLPCVDTNFIFECSTQYLMSEHSERERYQVKREKIKFISTSGHVVFCYYTDTDEISGKQFLGLILYSLNPV